MRFITVLLLLFGLTSCVTRLKGKCGENSEYSGQSVASIMATTKHVVSAPGEKRAVVFGLYGNRLIYTQGILENIMISHEMYPGWDVVVFIHTDTVPADYVQKLKDAGAVVFASSEYNHASARFFIADKEYDRFISRDADSRIYPREVAAVADWMTKKWAIVHGMRDYGAQTDPLQAGMWGAEIKPLREKFKAKYGTDNMEQLYKDFMKDKVAVYGTDQIFLKDIVLEAVGYDAFLSHESVDCKAYPHSEPFPIPRGNSDVYIGRRIQP